MSQERFNQPEVSFIQNSRELTHIELTLRQLPIVFIQSKTKMFFFTIFLFVIGGLLLSLYLSSSDASWAVAAVACFLIVCGVALGVANFGFPPPTLIIDQKGVHHTFLNRHKTVFVWKDVESINIFKFKMSKFISYQYNKASGKTRMPGGYMLPKTGYNVDRTAMTIEILRQYFTNENNLMREYKLASESESISFDQNV